MSPVAKSRRTSHLVGIAAFLILIGLLAWSWTTGGIAAQLLNTAIPPDERVAQLKQFFRDLGPAAPLVYLIFVIIEVVVAPLPGLMLYAPGGILFGPFLGGLLALIGNILGAGIACSITRSIGGNRLTRFFAADKLHAAQKEIEARGMLLIFLLRLNPLTSSDIVSYAAGFTQIAIWKVMCATACGMAPLCFAQAWLAEGLISAFPRLIYPLAAACVIYAVVLVLVIRRMLRSMVTIAPHE